MKTITCILSLMLVAVPCALLGQTLTHPWWVTDGGGGKSSGASLTLSASIGQSNVQKTLAPGFTLEEGFIPGLRQQGGTTANASLFVEGLWNILSVPLITSDFRKTSVYPTAVSSAFTFDPIIGYVRKDTLQIGIGYWVKFNSIQSVAFTGSTVPIETIHVNTGWNMIGALSYPMPTSAIAPIPPVVVRSQYFGYSNIGGFYFEDTLKPGLGYWVKVNQNGSLILKTSTMVPGASADNIMRNREKVVGPRALQALAAARFARLVIRDHEGRERSLFYSTEPKEIDLKDFELPPTPPGEVLDVRFASQRIAVMKDADGANQNYPIAITGGEFPLTVSWDGTGDNQGAVLEIFYDGEKPKRIELSEKGIVTIKEENFLGAKLRLIYDIEREIPKEFALYQNYPNPFNPTTKIRYDLPKDTKVSLKVYSILGEEAVTLVAEEKSAGAYTAEFNAANLPSGVYFYRLQAGDFTATKKFMLMK
ncbi:MAG: T9SS type A sorting domain-containing protein [Ignavibacteria bacterium]|nr:T9SS type A sorting domain-containing protein [Ignavibacteria bacterium]MBI3765457.1 T9SS type A sorting domain-containing protein [Ignavibacteriales bacterium]